MDKQEKVLCIKKSLLPGEWVARKSIIPMTLERFVTGCTAAGFSFIQRGSAENDPSQKQIIPYIMLQSKDFKKTAVYQRNGSEKRLHDLWSLGIGGHINPVDVTDNNDAFEQILLTGMQRELDEELLKVPGKDQAEFLGVISEDITDVGKVHLGVVFRITTENCEDYLPGEELFEFKWEKTENLSQLDFELWSEMALSLAAC